MKRAPRCQGEDFSTLQLSSHNLQIKYQQSSWQISSLSWSIIYLRKWKDHVRIQGPHTKPYPIWANLINRKSFPELGSAGTKERQSNLPQLNLPGTAKLVPFLTYFMYIFMPEVLSHFLFISPFTKRIKFRCLHYCCYLFYVF